RGRPPGKRIQTPPEVKGFKVSPTDVMTAVEATDVDFAPNPIQLKFAQLILCRETPWTYVEMSQELKVSPDTVNKWFNDQRFRVWLENVRHQLFMLYKPAVDRALI